MNIQGSIKMYSKVIKSAQLYIETAANVDYLIDNVSLRHLPGESVKII